MHASRRIRANNYATKPEGARRDPLGSEPDYSSSPAVIYLREGSQISARTEPIERGRSQKDGDRYEFKLLLLLLFSGCGGYYLEVTIIVRARLNSNDDDDDAGCLKPHNCRNRNRNRNRGVVQPPTEWTLAEERAGAFRRPTRIGRRRRRRKQCDRKQKWSASEPSAGRHNRIDGFAGQRALICRNRLRFISIEKWQILKSCSLSS